MTSIAIPNYYLWAEDIGPNNQNPPHTLLNPINCADTIYVDVWLPNWIYMSDYTSGRYVPSQTIDSTPANNTSFECITEWDGRDKGYGLADYNYISYLACKGWSTSGSLIDMSDTSTPVQDITTDWNGNYMSFPGNWGDCCGENFTVYWQGRYF